MADVIKLLHLFIFVNNIESNGFFLNQELGVLMLQEWRKILMLPLRGFFWIKNSLSIDHLELIVAMISCEVGV